MARRDERPGLLRSLGREATDYVQETFAEIPESLVRFLVPRLLGGGLMADAVRRHRMQRYQAQQEAESRKRYEEEMAPPPPKKKEKPDEPVQNKSYPIVFELDEKRSDQVIVSMTHIDDLLTGLLKKPATDTDQYTTFGQILKHTEKMRFDLREVVDQGIWMAGSMSKILFALNRLATAAEGRRMSDEEVQTEMDRSRPAATGSQSPLAKAAGPVGKDQKSGGGALAWLLGGLAGGAAAALTGAMGFLHGITTGGIAAILAALGGVTTISAALAPLVLPTLMAVAAGGGGYLLGKLLFEKFIAPGMDEWATKAIERANRTRMTALQKQSPVFDDQGRPVYEFEDKAGQTIRTLDQNDPRDARNSMRRALMTTDSEDRLMHGPITGSGIETPEMQDQLKTLDREQADIRRKADAIGESTSNRLLSIQERIRTSKKALNSEMSLGAAHALDQAQSDKAGLLGEVKAQAQALVNRAAKAQMDPEEILNRIPMARQAGVVVEGAQGRMRSAPPVTAPVVKPNPAITNFTNKAMQDSMIRKAAPKEPMSSASPSMTNVQVTQHGGNNLMAPLSARFDSLAESVQRSSMVRI